MASAKRNESYYYIGTSALEMGKETLSPQSRDQRTRFILIEGGLSSSDSAGGMDSASCRVRKNENGVKREALSSYDASNKLMLRALSPAQWGLVLLISIFMMVACLAISYNLEARAVGRMETALNSADTIEVTVVPGDTLWGIANQHQIDGIDTSEVVRWIEEVNHIDGGVIHVGQNLTVPTT